MRRLYDLFLGVDASQVEINPFAETKDGRGTSGQDDFPSQRAHPFDAHPFCPHRLPHFFSALRRLSGML
jgi:hypothetical protein